MKILPKIHFEPLRLATYRCVSGYEKPCRVMVDHDTTGTPNDWRSPVQDNYVEIILKANDTRRHAQGDQITLRDKECHVSNIAADDGVVIRVAVH